MRKTLLLAVAAAATTTTASPGTARADLGDDGRAIDAQLFKPALDPTGIFSLERARGPKEWDFGLRIGATFAQSPLKLDTLGADGNMGDGNSDNIIDNQTTLNFGISFGLSDKLTLGMDVPLMLQSLGEGFGAPGHYYPVDPNLEGAAQPGTGFYSTRQEQNTQPAGNFPGDVRLGLKYRILSGNFALALQGVAWVPFGDDDVFAGSAGFTLEPKLILESKLGAKGIWTVNAGARIRKGALAETRQVTDTGYVDNGAFGSDPGDPVFFPRLFVGSEAAVGGGALFTVNPKLSVGGEATFLIPIATADAMDCSGDCKNGDFTGEVLAGAFFGLNSDTRLAVAAGAGVIPGAARSEAFRVLASLTWTPTVEGARGTASRGDTDGDGIPDGPDVCPDEPEDPDEFQDDDGCPELDNDLDGVLDAQDKCPSEPEDRDGYEDGDGCAEGDNDHDNVPDLTDRCPGEAEDMDEYQDDDGCPDDDNDGDGILDAKDKCPNEAETVNGYQDLDGCADQGVTGGPKLVADRIDLQNEKIEFAGGKFTKASILTLDAVAVLMLKNPNERFRIQVGVEQTGTGTKKQKAADLKLTQQRAQAVSEYLQNKGVSAQALSTAGLGSERPIDAKNPKDPARNRRVEFIRLTQ